MSLAHGTSIVKDGLILNLDAANVKSYPGSGTSWYDLSGNNNDGTLINGVTYNDSPIKTLTFNRIDGYITTVGTSNFSYSNGITILVWHYNEGGDGLYRALVNNGTTLDRLGGFDLRYGRENYFGGADNGTKLSWAIRNSSNVHSSVNMYANLNEWHCYAFVYDNVVLKAYKDGQLFDSINHSAGGQLKTTSTSTTIGLSYGTQEYLNGKLSQMLIYDKGLTSIEIKQNFEALRGRYGV